MSQAVPANGGEHEGLPAPRRLWAITSIISAIVLSTLSVTSVNLGLPIMAQHFHIEAGMSLWIVNAMQLTLLAALLPCAALGEVWGYKRTGLLGLVLIAIASIGSAFASTLPELLAARVVHGLGSAAVFGVSSALLRLSVPTSRMGHAISLTALAGAVGTAFGPSVAALLLSVASWPWLFAINLPLAIFSLATGLFTLPEGTARANARFDYMGALLNVLAFALFFLGLDTLVRHGWSGLPVLAAGAMFCVLLVRHQRHLTAPLLPLDLLRIAPIRYSVVASAFTFGSQLGALVALPFLFHVQLGKSTADTGLLITTWPIAVGLMASVAPRLLKRFDSTNLCAAGCVTMAVGECLLALMPAQTPNAAFVAVLVMCGFGFGCFQTPNNRVLLLAAPLERSGGASGLQATARLTGQTFSATMATIAFQLSGVHAPAVTLLVCALMSLLGAASSLGRARVSAAAR